MSVPQRITCPHCQGSIKFPPLAPGSMCNCPKCGKGFPLPGNEASAPSAPDAKPQAATSSDGSSPAPATTPAPVQPEYSANTATQPAHRPKPPPPKPKPPPPAPTEVAVVCKLCGTRMYAPESKIGQTLRCPDCHSETEIKAPKVLAPPPKKKTLDELEEFQLSDPGERPNYKPMVEAKGEYADLQLLDTKAPPRRTEPDAGGPLTAAVPSAGDDPLISEASIPAPVSAPSLEHAATAVARIEDDLDDQEVVLSAPVERIEVKTEVKVPPLPPAPHKEERKEPTWNDAEWGFIGNPLEKGAWKQSPFYVGILNVFADPQMLLRLAAYTIGLTIALTLFSNVIVLGNSVDGQQIARIVCMLTFAVVAAFLTLFSSPSLLAIATDTANGEDKIQNWPDWSITEWLFDALYVPVAFVLAVIPGAVLASMFTAVGQGAQWFAPFPPLVSLLAIFPIVFSSMLVEGSVVSVISGNVLKSLRSHGEGWVVLYAISAFLFFLLSIGVVLVEAGIHTESGTAIFIFSAFAALLFVALAILYFRLLGRLMWYTQNVQQKEAE